MTTLHAGENNALIPSLGGVELVLSALRTHSSHTGIQAMGICALGNMAITGSLGMEGVMMCVTTVCRP